MRKSSSSVVVWAFVALSLHSFGCQKQPSAATGAWWQVVGEGAPLLQKPKSEAEKLTHQLFPGALLEKRVEERPEFAKEAKVASLKLDISLPEGGRVQRDGALVTAQLSPTYLGWAFASDLKEPAASIPSRHELCAAFAASGAMEKAPCESEAWFSLAGERHLVALSPGLTGPGRLAAYELQGRKVTGHMATGHVAALRQFALPEGGAVLVATEFIRKETLTGTQYAFLALGADGAFRRLHASPAQTSEPVGERVTQRDANLVVTDPVLPAFAVSGEERVQEISTGEVKSSRKFEEAVRWERERAQLAVQTQ